VYWKEFFKRRSAELYQALDLQLQSLPAKVIYREPGSWSSSVWLNVGEKQNESIGKIVVAKNSPVLSNGAIVGVVEYVGRSQCRVRLITDSGLVPSVRAIRGSEQNRLLLEHLDALTSGLQFREDLFSAKAATDELLQQLHILKQHLMHSANDIYLAKGELYGSSAALWRSRSQILHGVGFNYDFPDAEGPARDPRTSGILKIGDLLVTTGMDGVFPPGFKVATITKIAQLREGATSYEIEAKACAGNLDQLKHVLILPPLDFQKE
jgi:cell shape-determining protein MreC